MFNKPSIHTKGRKFVNTRKKRKENDIREFNLLCGAFQLSLSRSQFSVNNETLSLQAQINKITKHKIRKTVMS